MALRVKSFFCFFLSFIMHFFILQFHTRTEVIASCSSYVFFETTKSHSFFLVFRFFSKPCRFFGSRKEVFQPHLPVRLPCYDLAPVTCLALGRPSRHRTSSAPGSHGLTGGVYKARERIHRAVADARLLANPASWSRVADSNPN